MDVALAADGGCVAETLGNVLDRLDDVSLRLGLGGEGLELLQHGVGENCACPGAEVFGGEAGVNGGRGDLTQVIVDVGGINGVALAFMVEILEELVAGDIKTAANDGGEAAVAEVNRVFDAALAFEAEVERGALDGDVAVAHGGEAVGVVGAGVLFIADADEGGLHEADDGGEDFGARHVGEGKVMLDARAYGGESLAEEEHALVFGLVAHLAPAGMVAALLAPASIPAGGLKMTVCDGTNPDLLPSGRDTERLDASEGLRLGDRGAAGPFVLESFAAAQTADAGFGVGDVAETGGFGRFDGIGDDFREFLWRFTTAPGLHASVGCGSQAAWNGSSGSIFE